jgi:nitroreductase
MSTTTGAFRPLPLEFDRLPEAEMRTRSAAFLELMLRRRSVRQFSDEPVPPGLLEDALRVKEILERPENERPFLLVPVGYPAPGATTPTLVKKTLGEIADFV